MDVSGYISMRKLNKNLRTNKPVGRERASLDKPVVFVLPIVLKRRVRQLFTYQWCTKGKVGEGSNGAYYHAYITTYVVS